MSWTANKGAVGPDAGKYTVGLGYMKPDGDLTEALVAQPDGVADIIIVVRYGVTSVSTT